MLREIIALKNSMYSLFYYWLIVLASVGHHQDNIYKKTSNAGPYSTKTLIIWDIIYNYYQPLDVLSVVGCVEILYWEYCGCVSKIFLDLRT
jgi:hypothetical protein